MLETNQPVKPFLGVRFVLVGFDSVEDSKIRYKLIDGGGVESSQYNPNCTHVIVNKTVNDDPVCVAARKDCKTVVTGLWVDHSYDVGMPADFTSVIYRPPKELNGIPGAKGLVMCLTGYQRQDRDDIMTLVGLMGAQFSKPLVANKVTHLICYKFEGEKYELGKKLSKINLVNHRWLEDCLKEWEILPEANYSKSGYELEVMEAEAKDSEEEAEDTSLNPLAEETVPKSPCNLEPSFPKARNSPNLGVSNSKGKLTDFRSEGTSVLDNIPVTKDFEYNSVDDVAQHQYQSPYRKNAANNLTPSSQRIVRPPHSDVKSGYVSYTRKMLRNLGDLSGNHSGFDKDAMKAKDLSSSLAKQDQAKDARGSKSFESPKRSNLPQNCMQTNSYGTPSLKKTGSEVRPCIRKTLSPNDKVLGLDSSFFDRLGDTDIIEAEVTDKEIVRGADPRLESMDYANRGEKSSPSSPKRVKTSLSGSAQFGDFDAGNSSLHQPDDMGTTGRKSGHERDKPSSLNLERNEDSTTITKSLKKKMAAKKTLGSRPKIASKAMEKESMHLDTRDPNQDKAVGWSWDQGNEKSEKDADSALCEVPKETETIGDLKCEDSATRRTVTAPDDETETPEDRDEHALDKAAEEIEAANLVNGVTANTCHVAPEPEIKGNVSENVDDANVSVPSGSKSKGKGLKRKKAKEKATTSGKKKAKKVDMTEEFKYNKDCVDAEVTRNEASGATNEMENTEKDVNCPAAKSRASRKMLETSVEEEKENTPVNREAKKKFEDKRDSEKQAKTRSIIKKISETSDAVKSSGKIGSVVAKRDSEKQDKTRSDIKKSSGKSNNAKSSGKMGSAVDISRSEPELVVFILTGHRFQRREFQKIIRRLRGRFCRDTHQWSYKATHFIVPEPIRRTEKFFAAAASGRWILKTDYLTASSEAGKFLKEEDYEWHDNGLNDDGAINLEAPRKWRLLRQRTGHGAFYGMRIIIYGDCIAPSLDTLKRVVKAGDGTIVATSPPYTRLLNSGVDFAVVSPGMPRVDAWVQEFLKHELPCIAADYLVEYVCRPGSSLERHILYNTNSWAHKSSARLEAQSEEVVQPDEEGVFEEGDAPCGVCGSRDRGEVMLICSDEGGVRGCGIGCHIDCCDPPMEAVPQDDWFCSECSKSINRSDTTKKSKKKK